MRYSLVVFLAIASPALADESLSLWLKSAERTQDETICVIARSEDSGLTLQVQKPTNSFPAPARSIPASDEILSAFDSVLALIDARVIDMDEMNPDMPWNPEEGMELWHVDDGTEHLARQAGLKVPREVLALFDRLGDGSCTRLAER